MNGTTVSRRTLIQGAGAAAAVSMMPMGAAESEAAVVKNLPNLSQTGGRFNLALQQIRKSAEVQRPR